MCCASVSGTGHSLNGSEDIVLPHCDVDLVPQQMEERGVCLLHAVDCPALHREAVVAEVGHPSAIAASEADDQEPHLTATLQGAVDVGRGARSGDAEERV